MLSSAVTHAPITQSPAQFGSAPHATRPTSEPYASVHCCQNGVDVNAQSCAQPAPSDGYAGNPGRQFHL
jgi:hypothetical protein